MYYLKDAKQEISNHLNNFFLGGKYKSKHRRWFILKENMLYYFKQPTVITIVCFFNKVTACLG